MKIYWAAPFFDVAWQQYNAALSRQLRACQHEIFLPQETLYNSTSHEPTDVEIFDGDLHGIASSDLVVACIDGPVVDDGVAAELGLAFGMKKKCIGLITDLRWHRTGPGRLYRNLLITGLLRRSHGIVHTPDDLIRALDRLEESQ